MLFFSIFINSTFLAAQNSCEEREHTKKGIAQYLVHSKHSVHFNSSHNYFPQAALVVKNHLPTGDAGDAGEQVLMPLLGRSPEEGNGNPLQCSCQENPMNGGA